MRLGSKDDVSVDLAGTGIHTPTLLVSQQETEAYNKKMVWSLVWCRCLHTFLADMNSHPQKFLNVSRSFSDTEGVLSNSLSG